MTSLVLVTVVISTHPDLIGPHLVSGLEQGMVDKAIRSMTGIMGG